MFIVAAATSKAETRDDWIALGVRIHGGFGPFIPVGIRIGLVTVDELRAGPRDLTVTYLDGEKPPYPCIADKVMIATLTSPGQGTFEMAPNPARDELLAVVMCATSATGRALEIHRRR